MDLDKLPPWDYQLPEQKEAKPTKIPRPKNAFMLFSNDFRKKLLQSHGYSNNQEVSVKLGQMWKSLPENIKQSYFQKAEQEVIQHRLKYPGYKYQPRQRKTTKASTTPSPPKLSPDLPYGLASPAINPQAVTWANQETKNVSLLMSSAGSEKLKSPNQKLLLSSSQGRMPLQSGKNIFIPAKGHVIATLSHNQIVQGQNIVFIPSTTNGKTVPTPKVMMLGPSHSGRNKQALLLPIRIPAPVNANNLAFKTVMSQSKLPTPESENVTKGAECICHEHTVIKVEPKEEPPYESEKNNVTKTSPKSLETKIAAPKITDNSADEQDDSDSEDKLVIATPEQFPEPAAKPASSLVYAPVSDIKSESETSHSKMSPKYMESKPSMQSLPKATQLMPMLIRAPVTSGPSVTMSQQFISSRPLATASSPMVMPTLRPAPSVIVQQPQMMYMAPSTPGQPMQPVMMVPQGMPVMMNGVPMIPVMNGMPVMNAMPVQCSAPRANITPMQKKRVAKKGEETKEKKSDNPFKSSIIQKKQNKPGRGLSLNVAKLMELEAQGNKNDPNDDDSLAPISHLVGIAMATTKIAESLTGSSFQTNSTLGGTFKCEPPRKRRKRARKMFLMKNDLLEENDVATRVEHIEVSSLGDSSENKPPKEPPPKEPPPKEPPPKRILRKRLTVKLSTPDKKSRAARHRKSFNDYEEFTELNKQAKKRPAVTLLSKAKTLSLSPKRIKKVLPVNKKKVISRGRVYRSGTRFAKEENDDEIEEEDIHEEGTSEEESLEDQRGKKDNSNLLPILGTIQGLATSIKEEPRSDQEEGKDGQELEEEEPEWTFGDEDEIDRMEDELERQGTEEEDVKPDVDELDCILIPGSGRKHK